MSTPTAAAETTRNATLDDMVALLTDQQTRKLDMVVPADRMRADGTDLVIAGMEPQYEITEQGVTTTELDGRFTPTEVFDEGLAAKLGINLTYLRRMRTEFPSLYADNVNAWLHGREGERDADERAFFFRSFRGHDGADGVARALTSDRYRAMDNLDILTATLTGIHDTGTRVDVHSTDLSERKMIVRLHAPEIAAAAPVLLANYRNPFADPELDAQRRHNWNPTTGFGYGYEPGTEPVVFAGIRISNSEVGGGAFTMAPELRVKICTNGMVISADLMRNVHLGGKLEVGAVEWSEATQRKALDLITSKTADAVRTWLNPEYLARTIARIEEQAGKPVADAEKTITTVANVLKFTEVERSGILNHFIRGGQMTAGGVLNAVTSYSQTVVNADRADQLDGSALRVLALV